MKRLCKTEQFCKVYHSIDCLDTPLRNSHVTLNLKDRKKFTIICHGNKLLLCDIEKINIVNYNH